MKNMSKILEKNQFMWYYVIMGKTMKKIIFIIFVCIFYSNIYAQGSEKEMDWGPSLWQIMTDDSQYLIQDYGTRPAPRTVVVRNLENNEIVFSGSYYENINLQGHTIEIVQFYGEYYGGKWSINRNLSEEEKYFAEYFLKTNEPPEELMRIADLAKGNGMGLLIIFEYNIKTRETKIIGGKYIGTM
jgi:hypothetical protein